MEKYTAVRLDEINLQKVPHIPKTTHQIVIGAVLPPVRPRPNPNPVINACQTNVTSLPNSANVTTLDHFIRAQWLRNNI